MKVVRYCLAGLLALPPLAGRSEPAAAQIMIGEPPDTPYVAASAAVQVPVPADRAIVYIALAGRDTTGARAVAELEVVRSRVLPALERLGYDADAVVPWGYGVGVSMDPRMGPPGRAGIDDEPERMARQGLRVVVNRLDQLDALIGAVAAAGIEGVPLVHFEATQTADVRRRATEQAVAQARQQAEHMARAAGGRLGPLVSLVTMPDFGPGISAVDRFLTFPPGMDRGAQLLASDVTVKVSVQAVWQFESN